MAKLDKPSKTRFPVRLQRAITDCEVMTKDARENRAVMLERYSAGFFTGRLNHSARPINMIWRYLNIMVPFLVSNNPKSLVTAKHDISLTSFAETMGLALDHLRREIEFVSVMREIVLDALIGVGVSKVGIAPNSNVEIGGHTYQAGQPYFERIDYDDIRFDVAARSRRDMKFFGHRYRLPLWYVRESGLYKNYDKLDIASAMYGSETSSEKVNKKEVGDSEYHELQEYVELYDLWLPDEGIMVTLPRDGEGDKYLRVVDDFPETGPFDMLGFHWVPGHPLPIPPSYAILDLDDQLNRMMRRIQRQADREKTVLAYEGDATDDARNVVEGTDGEAVRVDSIDRIKEVTFGGVNERALQIAQWLRNNVAEQGGNLDMVGGYRAEADTLGQEQMLQANATQVLDDYVAQVHNFTSRIERKLSWYLWHDPLIQIPVTKELPVVGEVHVMYSEQAKEGDWLDYNIDIEPYSLQTNNPETQYRKMLQWVSQVIMPLLPVAGQQGVSLNVDELVQATARYLDVPNVKRFWSKGGMPQQTKVGPYQPMQGQVVKGKGGQADNRYNQDDGMANHNQQQSRAGGMSSVDSAMVGNR